MLDRLTDRIRKSAAGKPGFGKAILLDLGEEGGIRIDGAGAVVAVDNDAEAAADTTVSMTAETLDKLMKGEINAPMAVMTGKIKIRGDSGLALKLAGFLG